jgi:hypothetical protein
MQEGRRGAMNYVPAPDPASGYSEDEIATIGAFREVAAALEDPEPEGR